MNPANYHFKTMSRPAAVDPLVPFPVRLPTSVVERWRVEAETRGVTLSDLLRSHLTVEAAKPLGNAVPLKRVKLVAAPEVDPELTRAINRAGENINQIARNINTATLVGSGVNVVTVLIEMKKIRETLDAIYAHQAV